MTLTSVLIKEHSRRIFRNSLNSSS